MSAVSRSCFLSAMLILTVAGITWAQDSRSRSERGGAIPPRDPATNGWSLPGQSVFPRATANVRLFGANGNGVRDDTDAIQAAIDSLSESGGVVLFPAGRYLVNGPLVLPNDGQRNNPRQPPYIFRGEGAHFDGRAGPPSGGSILDLRPYLEPKIATYGLGLLEIEGLTLADFANDDGTFIYTTNTTLHIHDCGFFGTNQGSNARNDAIVLGGTDAALVGTSALNAPFQGYGTVIRDNYFGRIRRMVFGRVFANAIAVYGNTVWSNSGSNLPGGAAIELDGDPDETTPQVNAGWYVAGNLIEMVGYAYGVKTRESQRNAFIGNHFFDPGAGTLAFYRFEPSGKVNYVLAGFHDDWIPFVDDQAVGVGRSTVVNFHQQEESVWSQQTRFQGPLYLEPHAGAVDPFGPRLLSSGGAELTYQLDGDDSMVVSYTPNGGSQTPLWQVKDYGSGSIVQELKGTQAGIRNLNGSVEIQAKTGSTVALTDTAGVGLRVDGGALELTATSARILTGAGVPAEQAPDGSIYLRVDGGAGATLYVREAGVWVAK